MMERDMTAEFTKLAMSRPTTEQLHQWYDGLSVEERVVLRKYLNRQLDVVQNAITALVPAFDAIVQAFDGLKSEVYRVLKEVEESGVLSELKEFIGQAETSSLDGGNDDG